jgi:uncharacterized protein YlxW (UPF0749 family)
VVSGLVFALAGLMFAAAANTSQGTDLRAQRAVELRDLVRQKSDRVALLEQTTGAQQQEVDDLSEGRIGDPEAVVARSGIARLAPAAGLTPVSGRALIVALDDAPLREPDDPLIVHQADVQAVVNAMWRGGASAIQVMDQRLINTSSIQCVGNTLLLQGRVYSPPFVVTAVGPLKRMRASLHADPVVSAYRAWAGAVGLGYDVSTDRDVTVPGYTGPITMAFAVPQPPGTAESAVSTDPAASPTALLPSQ